MILLRDVRPADLTRLYHLDQICFAQGIAFSLTDFKYFLANPRCFSLMAEENGERLAGFIIVERERGNRGAAGHIITIDIDPEMRRQGLGTRLLDEAGEWLKKEGATRLNLEVAEDNASAQIFYRSLGFVPAGRVANYYPGGVAAELMEKSL